MHNISGHWVVESRICEQVMLPDVPNGKVRCLIDIKIKSFEEFEMRAATAKSYNRDTSTGSRLAASDHTLGSFRTISALSVLSIAIKTHRGH